MRKDNIAVEKSYAFAIRMVKCYVHLRDTHNEYVLSKQLLRCGTSIGANLEEAVGGQSEKDFYTKLCISYKEARETNYWLRLLRDTAYLEPPIAESLLSDCEELLKLIGSITKTLKEKLRNA
jgi:four helix bundle protein